LIILKLGTADVILAGHAVLPALVTGPQAAAEENGEVILVYIGRYSGNLESVAIYSWYD